MYFCEVWVYGNVKGHSAGRSGNQTLALELFCICLHTIQTNFPSHSSHVWLPVDHEVLAHSQPGKPILPASGPNEAHEPDVTASTYTLSPQWHDQWEITITSLNEKLHDSSVERDLGVMLAASWLSQQRSRAAQGANLL